MSSAKIHASLATISQNQAKRTKCDSTLRRLEEIETKIKLLNKRTNEKKNRVFLRQAFRKKCEQFMSLQAEYRLLLEEQASSQRNSAAESRHNVNNDIFETTTTIAIKNVCEKLKSLSRNLLQGSSDEDQNQNLCAEIQAILDSASPHTVLMSFAMVLRAAIKEIRTLTNDVGETVAVNGPQKVNTLDVSKLQKRIQLQRAEHVARFVETEKLANEAAEMQRRIETAQETIEARLDEHSNGKLRAALIAVIHAKAKAEGNYIRYQALSNHISELAASRDKLQAQTSDLLLLHDTIEASTTAFTERQMLAVQLMKSNQAAQSHVKDAKEKGFSFAQNHIFPFRAELESLQQALLNKVSAEKNAFRRMDLARASYIIDENSQKIPVIQSSTYRAEYDPFARELARTLRCSLFLVPETIVYELVQLKQRVTEAELAEKRNNDFFQCAYDSFYNLNCEWNPSKDEVPDTLPLRDIADQLTTSTEELKENIERDEAAFLDKHLNRLRSKVKLAEEVEAIDVGIRGILDEQTSMLSGSLCSQQRVNNKTYVEFEAGMRKRSGKAEE